MHALATLALSLLIAAPAFAQSVTPAPEAVPSPQPPPASPPGSPPPGYYPPPGYGPPPGYYPPPGYAPPPGYGPVSRAEDSTVRRHDGFYLRMGLGVGYGHVGSTGTFSLPSGGAVSSFDLSATYDGWGSAYELLIGGTLARGFVLGGGFVGQDISNPNLSTHSNALPAATGNLTASGSLGVGALGPFVDWFPNDRKGLHFGAMIGLAILGLQNDSGKLSSGVAGALWGGHDFWVADQWSLGGEARVAGVSAKRDFSDYSGTMNDKALSIELLFTALYH